MNKLLILIPLLLVNVGCANFSMQRGLDEGTWSLCNYPYPYIDGSVPNGKCQQLLNAKKKALAEEK